MHSIAVDCIRAISIAFDCIRLLPIAVALAFALASSALAGGSVGTRFALVEMPGVVPGKTCAACLPDGSYYSLRNESDVPLKVRLACEPPGYIEPCPGTNYVALPDCSWVAFEPAEFDLPPRSEAESLVTVAIPDEPAHYGRHYEFHIRASAVAGQAGVALVSRVRLDTIEEEARDARKAKKPRKAEVRSLEKKRSFWSRLAFWRREKKEAGE